MDVRQAVAYAREYLHAVEPDAASLESYRLHRQLQYRLCHSVERILRVRGEVPRADVVMLVEAWIMGAPDHTKPLVLWDEPCR